MVRFISRRAFSCCLLATLTLVNFASCKKPIASEANAAPTTGEVKLDVRSHDEVMQALQSHLGKVVVMDVWSTACEPCMTEFPGLVAIHKKHGGKVACVSLSCDYIGLGKPEDVAGPVLDFLKKQGATFQNYLSSDADEKLHAKLGIPSIPAVFIYGKDGKLHKKIAAEFSYKDVEKIIDELLK